MTPEEFVKDYTSHCSNAVQGYDDMQNPVIEYHPWLTPEQALRAVEIAREEMIDKAYKYINYQLNLPNDFEQHFRKAMKKLILSALATIMMVGCAEHNGTYIKDENNFGWEDVYTLMNLETCNKIEMEIEYNPVKG